MVVRSPCGTSEETSLNLQPRGHAHPASTGSLCAALSSALGITAGRARPPCFSVPKSACGKGGHPWGPRASDPTAGGGRHPGPQIPQGGEGEPVSDPTGGAPGLRSPLRRHPGPQIPVGGKGEPGLRPHWGDPGSRTPRGDPGPQVPAGGTGGSRVSHPAGGCGDPGPQILSRGRGGRRPRISDPANAGEVGSHTPVWGPRASTLRGAVGTLDLRSRLGDAGNPRSLTTATGSGAWQYHSLQPANPGADSSGLERANPGGSL